jgi:hypothetical protein
VLAKERTVHVTWNSSQPSRLGFISSQDQRTTNQIKSIQATSGLNRFDLIRNTSSNKSITKLAMANRLQPPEEQVKRRVRSQVISAYLFKFSKYQQGNAILD